MPRTLTLTLIVLLAALSCVAAPAPAPVNLDFESGAPGEPPPGWSAPFAKYGFPAEISAESPKQGKQSARVSGTSMPTPQGHPSFGNLMQHVDAKPYRGKRVRFRAAVRFEGAGHAALWFRVDRAGQQAGFFDNMNDRPIGSPEWAYYEIAGDVADDAETLNFGMMVARAGTAWIDDASIEVVAGVEKRAAPPRAVSARGLENLVAFTRLFGIVRHFHASDEAAAANWEAIALDSVDIVERAKDPAELAARLSEVFLPLAPSLRVYLTGNEPPPPMEKPAGAEAIVAWEHNGFGQKQARSIYQSERVRRALADVDARFPDPSQPLQLDLGGGVSASIPLAVYADASRTLPRPAREAPEYSTALPGANDRATRTADVVILWNVIQHFYPYFDVVEVNWPAELRTALQAAGTDRDADAFARTLRRMVAAIDDGHGAVHHGALARRTPLPLLWRALGDALVITSVDPSAARVSVGDEVVAIDGKPVLQLLRDSEALISSASSGWRRAMAAFDVSTGTPGKQAVLTIRNADGTTRTATLAYTPRADALREKRPDTISELKPGLWYVDLTRASDAEFDASLEKLAAAKGIVFDLRGYPRVSSKPIRHMIDKEAQSAYWNVPILRRPDRAGLEWNRRQRWQLAPLQPRLPKNAVFLTDGRAISYAESWMGIVEAYKLGTIVGEPTAATNGNVNPFRLPGDYSVIFTGMQVIKHDGSRHHGVGIVPAVPVSPTAAGIRAGRDEQLEKAISILEQ
jgi:Peptidase family S41